MRWWLLTIGLALMTAPAAMAGGQDANDPQLVLLAEQGPRVLEPGGPAGVWNLTIEYHAAVPTPEEVTVHLSADGAEDHWQVRVEPSEITFRPVEAMDSPTDREVTLHGTASVAATEQAPAFHPDRLYLEAVSEPTALTGSARGTTEITATAGFHPGLEVHPEQETLTAPTGDEIHVRSTLDNLANGALTVTYGTVDAPSGCQVDPIHDEHAIDRALSREAVFHLACDDGASGGELSVTYEQAYAPDTSIEGPPVTQTWDVEIERSTAAETQAAVLGTSASVGGVPVAAWAAVLVGAIAGGVRVYREA